MNAKAPEFVPAGGKSRGGSKVMPPAPVAATKLRAAAVPFTPGAKGGSPSPSNSAESNNNNKSSGSQQQQHVDVVAEPTSPLSVKASPYTPTNAKLAAKFPTVPPSAVDPDDKTSPQETQSTEPELPPAAEPIDWAESKLPQLFGCHNTKAMATRDPIPLHSTWDLYADDHATTAAVATPAGPGATPAPYEPILISSVSDVESFWRLWRHVSPPSTSANPYTYSWFRKDVRPEWEHSRNKRGGTFSLVIYDRDRPGLNDKQVLDDVFMAALIGCIGESFSECSTTVNGIMLKLRPNKPVIMQVWTSHSELSKLKSLANSLKDTLGKVMDKKLLGKLEYYSHHQKQALTNSLASRFTKLKPDHTF